MWLLLFLKFQQWDRCKNILSRAQLAEKSLVTPEVHCSIQSSANTCQLYQKDKKREKETGGMARLKDFFVRFRRDFNGEKYSLPPISHKNILLSC